MPAYGSGEAHETGDVLDQDELDALEALLGDDDEAGDVVLPLFDETTMVDAEVGDIYLEEDEDYYDEAEEGGLRRRKRRRRIGKGGRKRSFGRAALTRKLRKKGISNRNTNLITAEAQNTERMNKMGRIANGKYTRETGIPFIFGKNIKIHSVVGIRQGETVPAKLLEDLMLEQVRSSNIFQQFITTTVPAAGATIKLEDATELVDDVTYKGLITVIRVSTANLTRNDGKIFSVTLQTATGEASVKDMYTVKFSYEGQGPAELVLVPAVSVNDKYYPRTVDLKDAALAADTLNYWVKIEGNDGVNDTVTAIVIG